MTHEKNLTLLLLPHQNVKTYASKYKCVSKILPPPGQRMKASTTLDIA